jgi:hypothetical protein
MEEEDDDDDDDEKFFLLFFYEFVFEKGGSTFFALKNFCAVQYNNTLCLCVCVFFLL